VKESYDPVLILLKKMEERVKKFGSFVRIYEGLRHYHAHRGTVVKTIFISVIVHAMVGWACLNFAKALGDNELTLLQVYLVVPMGLLVTAIPIAPAGVGTGNLAFHYLFKLVGSDKGADVFSLFAMTNILIGVIGGLVYLRFKAREPEMRMEAVRAVQA
jgi:uncharacterized membrane protein YbhN (UPF0104 family)